MASTSFEMQFIRVLAFKSTPIQGIAVKIDIRQPENVVEQILTKYSNLIFKKEEN